MKGEIIVVEKRSRFIQLFSKFIFPFLGDGKMKNNRTKIEYLPYRANLDIYIILFICSFLTMKQWLIYYFTFFSVGDKCLIRYCPLTSVFLLLDKRDWWDFNSIFANFNTRGLPKLWNYACSIIISMITK